MIIFNQEGNSGIKDAELAKRFPLAENGRCPRRSTKKQSVSFKICFGEEHRKQFFGGPEFINGFLKNIILSLCQLDPLALSAGTKYKRNFSRMVVGLIITKTKKIIFWPPFLNTGY